MMSINILIVLFLNLLLPSFSFHVKPKPLFQATKLKAQAVDNNFNVALGITGFGIALGLASKAPIPLVDTALFGSAVTFSALGAFIGFQTTQIKFTFDNTNFSLLRGANVKAKDNIVVGGENSWRYNSFVNYAFLPNEEFPVLFYFKETQTPKDKRIKDPIVIDNLEGQAHFFPCVCNAQQLKSQLIKYKVKTLNK